MNSKTILFSFLIAILLATLCLAEPSESSSAAAPSASSSQKCPPIACTQPSGKPKCPSECPDSCQFENDKCCPNKQVGVCSSSASGTVSGSSSATATAASSGGISASSSPSASSGASSSPNATSGSSSSPSPSTSSGVPIRNNYHTYLFTMTICVLCVVLLY